MGKIRSLGALLLVLTLVACGQGNQAATPSGAASAASVPTSNTAPIETTIPSAPVEATASTTEVANEEITTSPESLTITPGDEQTTETAAEGTAEATGASEFTPGGTATGEWDCGDTTKLSDNLAIFSWADYWPEEDDNNILTDFEEACGVQVTVDTFPSNEDLAAKLRAGNSGYDIIVPSDYMVEILATEGRLAKLDTSLLPNMANLDPNQLNLYYDPNNDYSVPYQYGATGIAYNRDQVNPAPDSWGALLDPQQLQAISGGSSMFDDERESVGAALKYLGFSYNSTDPAQLEQAKQVLLAQKPLLTRYDSESYSQGLSSGELVIAQAWNGNASLAKSENDSIEWIVPKEGGVIWQDNLAIPADAPNSYTAHVFINNVLDGQIGARITNYTYYQTPNKAAEPFIDEEVKAIQFIPTEEERQRLEYIERKGDPAIYSDVWTQVKGQ